MKSIGAIILLGVVIVAHGAETKKPDPLDITAAQRQIEELGVPTPTIVADLQQKAKGLEAQQKWQEAEQAYALLAKTSNWLANLIGSGLQPFYSASYDDRGAILSRERQLVRVEKQSNNYRAIRDEASVCRAECLLKLGDTKTAVAVLTTTLDVLSADDAALWARARKDLYGAIQFTGEPTK